MATLRQQSGFAATARAPQYAAPDRIDAMRSNLGVLAVAGGAVLLTFVFLCVTGYAWLSIQLGPVFGGLANRRDRRSCIRPCARSDPPAGQRGAGGAGSRDKGADRSESPERRDAGLPSARLAAADSACLARLSRRAMGAGSAARAHTQSDCLMCLIAARTA